MLDAKAKVLGLIALGVAAVVLAATNLSAWAWWENAGTQREMYDALIIGFNGFAAICIIVGGALGAAPFRKDSGDDHPGPSASLLSAHEGPSVIREMFYDIDGDAGGYELAIRLGFVLLLCGHALIVYSRMLT